jgi:hypothetical protein
VGAPHLDGRSVERDSASSGFLLGGGFFFGFLLGGGFFFDRVERDLLSGLIDGGALAG